MEYGKQVCSHLKEIRRQIAKDNDIALDIPECTYQGECSGTCPRCEMELQILEKELTRRSLLGKAAMIAGVTVSLATCQNAMAQEPVSPQKQQMEQTETNVISLKGIITDAKTEEPLIGASVLLKTNGQTVTAARTDFDGKYEIKNIIKGRYDLEISCFGYFTVLTILNMEHVPDGMKYRVINEAMVKRYDSFEQEKAIIVGMPSVDSPAFNYGDPTQGWRFTSDQIEHFPTP